MCAFLYRITLHRTVFIGITGSVGKTTTKKLIAGILETHFHGVRKSPSSWNFPHYIARLVLNTRRSDAFCVAEIAIGHQFGINLSQSLFRPTVGVVTTIGDDHLAAYGSRDAIAAEKGKLIQSLPRNGIAILNADDPLVLAMRSRFSGRTVTYGLSNEAALRAERIEASWPDRLSFSINWKGQTARVQTLLCGDHWIPVVLAALATAVAVGLPLAVAAAAIGSIEPFQGRMSPVQLEDGVTFIRDDNKAPVWTLDTCFAFMKQARAARKIVVIGGLSETGSDKGRSYRRAATRAQEIADEVIFVGSWASSALKARAPGREDALHAFSHVRDAAEYLNSITRPGDLVLLKGINRQDHLIRIIMARSDAIACWREDCQRYLFCDVCPDKNHASGRPSMGQTPNIEESGPSKSDLVTTKLNKTEQIVVGLGNPHPKYHGTPHNIGYEVLDQIASSLGLMWEKLPNVWIARGTIENTHLCMFKIQKPMNLIGTELKHLAERMLFNPDQCILVFDDIHIGIGSVRNKMSGGAGGHRGVASILEAFQTDNFRRVKIGIKKSGGKPDLVKYVLTPFDKSERPTMDQSILEAGKRVIEMARNWHKSV